MIKIAHLVVVSMLSLWLARPAAAQGYPTRSITFIVPFATGGPVDNVGRTFAEAMRRHLGQSILVDNKPGAGGLVGTRALVAAKPDGYTLMIGSAGTLVISPMVGWAGPDMDRQTTPIGAIAESPQIIVVSPELKVRTLAEFVAYAKARPGTLNIGSGGIGTIPHLAAEILKAKAGLDLLHVPYRGTAAGLPDLLSGRTAIMFGDITAVLALVDAGRLPGLAITAPKRSPLAPAIPTTAEEGWPDLNTRNWQALVGPAELPVAVVNRLAEAMRAAAADKEHVAALERQGSAPTPSSPDHLRQHIVAEKASLGPIIKSLNLKLE